MSESISVIIPAYNEEENLEKAVARTVSVLQGLGREYEVIIVDDGSADRTAEIADGLASHYDGVWAIHQQNKGFGGAVLKGLGEARHQLITYNSADSQFDIGELDRLLAVVKDADMVLGYRTQRSDYSLYRRINSLAYTILLRLLFGLRFRDVNWIHLYRREVFDKVTVTSTGVFFCAEVVIKAFKAGLRIAQVETSYYPRMGGVARGGKITVVAKTFADMLRTWRKLRDTSSNRSSPNKRAGAFDSYGSCNKQES